MRALVFLPLVLPVLLAGVACGTSKQPACSLTPKEARPQVAIVWHVEHGSMDDDPPRPKVKVVVGSETVDLGELTGICKMVEVGAQLADPVYGSKVTELGCTKSGGSSNATIFLEAPGKLSIRKWERKEGSEALEKVVEVKVLEVPNCAVFTSEVAQQGGL
ncbi:MAG: hypothetical protein ACXWUG_04340 [Polyangiales bacterium]